VTLSGDSLVGLLRRAHARNVSLNATLADVGHASTPTPHGLTSATLEAPGSVGTVAPGMEEFEDGPLELRGHERYRLVRLLGVGGMGAVYMAEHRVMQRPVALKVINRAYTARATSVERFRREVRAAARLAHPNIVTAHDADNAGDTHFLVMEYVEGIGLGRLVKERGPLPVAEACAYIRQAALGLQHAHEKGMVHRDVKPDNLIRCADGTVKVLDFGLAALTAEREGGLTDENAVMGTPEYMAPEQAEDSRRADIRADVYSLGCTLYYLLTGGVPYPAETALQRILAHRDKPLPSIRQARPEVSPELADVLGRMLAKKPQDRYSTPGEVAAALEPFANPQPARPRSRWPLMAAALAAVLFLAAAIVIYRIQTDKGDLVITTEGEDVEVIVKQGGKVVHIIDTKSENRVTLRSGVYELELKGKPTGLKLNIDRATLTRGKEVLAKIERVPRPAPGEAADVKVIKPLHRIHWAEGRNFTAVDVTQDGRLFLAACKNVDKVRVWDMQTGKQICEVNGYVGRFTPDGRHVIASHCDPDFHLHELPTGKLVRHFGSQDQCWNFVLSSCRRTEWHCGTHMTFVGEDRVVVSDTGYQLFFYDSATGKLLRTVKHQGQIQSVAPSPDDRCLLSVGADQQVRVWAVREKKPHLMSLYVSGRQWIAWTPEGYYAATPGGDRVMGFTLDHGINRETSTVPAERFRRVLYRPDVLKLVLEKRSVEEALKVANAALRKEKVEVAEGTADIEKLLPPTVKLSVVDQSKLPEVRLKVEAVAGAKEQPIQALRLLVDGRPFPGKGGQTEYEKGKEKDKDTVEWTVTLPPGMHQLAVLARSADASGVSSEVPIDHRAKTEIPTLHVIAVGINKYEDPGLELTCAARDAEGIVAAFKKGCKGEIYGEVRAAPPLIDEKATRDAVLKAIEELRTDKDKKVKDNDLLVIFFAGHGVTKKNRFFLLTYDANVDGDLDKLEATSLSGKGLREALGAFPCQVLLVMDACHSGAFGGTGKLTRKEFKPGSEEAARKMADSEIGVAVLCAAMGWELSEGSKKLGYGLFSKAMIDGLSTNNKIPHNEETRTQTIRHLHIYVEDRVSVDSEGKQHPFLYMPWTMDSFALRKLPAPNP
jgi:hypothetical protein